MPSQLQRQRAGVRNYDASPLKRRNDALARAAKYDFLRRSRCVDHDLLAGFLAKPNVTLVEDYCTDMAAASEQIDKGLEPFLLVEDFYNPGEFTKVAIYDRPANDAFEVKSKRGWLDLNSGAVLAHADTLIYWK